MPSRTFPTQPSAVYNEQRPRWLYFRRRQDAGHDHELATGACRPRCYNPALASVECQPRHPKEFPSMAHPFLERITAGPLLCDGAMGTMLHTRGMSFDGSFDGLNLTP